MRGRRTLCQQFDNEILSEHLKAIRSAGHDQLERLINRVQRGFYGSSAAIKTKTLEARPQNDWNLGQATNSPPPAHPFLRPATPSVAVARPAPATPTGFESDAQLLSIIRAQSADKRTLVQRRPLGTSRADYELIQGILFNGKPLEFHPDWRWRLSGGRVVASGSSIGRGRTGTSSTKPRPAGSNQAGTTEEEKEKINRYEAQQSNQHHHHHHRRRHQQQQRISSSDKHNKVLLANDNSKTHRHEDIDENRLIGGLQWHVNFLLKHLDQWQRLTAAEVADGPQRKWESEWLLMSTGGSSSSGRRMIAGACGNNSNCVVNWNLRSDKMCTTTPEENTLLVVLAEQQASDSCDIAPLAQRLNKLQVRTAAATIVLAGRGD